MSEPYTPDMVTSILHQMPDDRLAAVTARSFQTWPARKVSTTVVLDELISNERAVRRARHG